MTVESSQHDIYWANPPEGFTFSIHLLEPKTKMLIFFCVLLKKIIYEPNQHFVVLWLGLLGSLFLFFRLSYQPGGVYAPSPQHLLGWVSLSAFCWAGQGQCCCQGMSAGTEGSQIFSLYICVCLLLAGRRIPEVWPNFAVNFAVFKRTLLKYLLENLPLCGSVSQFVWTLMKWHRGKPCATVLNRNIHYS